VSDGKFSKIISFFDRMIEKNSKWITTETRQLNPRLFNRGVSAMNYYNIPFSRQVARNFSIGPGSHKQSES